MEPKASATLAKLTCPDARRALARPRLFDALDAARKRRIVWVEGPPGTGKTVLLSSYLNARKLGKLWYQLDAGDGDIATFFHYLGLAAQKAAPRHRKPLPAFSLEYLPGLPIFTRCYVEALGARLKPPFVMVLDNYEQVPSEAPLHEVLGEAVAALP
ncbi:MAG: AAA family ATPase, partial [bacterium]